MPRAALKLMFATNRFNCNASSEFGAKSQNSESAGRMQVHGKYTAAQIYAFYRSLNTIIVKQPKVDAQFWNTSKRRRR